MPSATVSTEHMPPQGVPKESPKPHPPGSLGVIALLTTCTMCALYLLWRRAQSLRSIVSHQLNTWAQSDGRIRLSEDDGPSATEFIDDDGDAEGEDDEDEDEDVPLALRLERFKTSAVPGRVREPERIVDLATSRTQT